MNTPTPRTDAYVTKMLRIGIRQDPGMVELSQEIERDLAAAQEARQRAEALAERLGVQLYRMGVLTPETKPYAAIAGEKP